MGWMDAVLAAHGASMEGEWGGVEPSSWRWAHTPLSWLLPAHGRGFPRAAVYSRTRRWAADVLAARGRSARCNMYLVVNYLYCSLFMIARAGPEGDRRRALRERVGRGFWPGAPLFSRWNIALDTARSQRRRVERYVRTAVWRAAQGTKAIVQIDRRSALEMNFLHRICIHARTVRMTRAPRTTQGQRASVHHRCRCHVRSSRTRSRLGAGAACSGRRRWRWWWRRRGQGGVRARGAHARDAGHERAAVEHEALERADLAPDVLFLGGERRRAGRAERYRRRAAAAAPAVRECVRLRGDVPGEVGERLERMLELGWGWRLRGPGWG